MRKRFLSILLAVLMVLSIVTLLPFTASAAHSLIVKKNGRWATSGTDYEWDTTDTNKLIIKTNGLTVSGTTTAEYIEVDTGVNDLTIKDLTINRGTDGNAIKFKDYSGLCTLTVKGSNSISGTDALYFEGSAKITGTGDLSATGSTGNGINNPDGNLTLDCSGTVTVKGACVGICFFGDLAVTESTGTVVVCGNGDGAFQVTGALTIDPSLAMTGSTTYDAAVADITGEAAFDNGSHCIKTGGAVAKSVLIKGPHKLNVTKSDGTAAAEGTDYEWDATSPKRMNILVNGLTVTGTGVLAPEYIETVDGVTDLTIKNLSIENDTWAIYFSDDSALCTLTVLGNNTLIGTHPGCGAVSFDGNGKITGTGNISGSTILSWKDLTLDCSGTITADNGNGSYGIAALGTLTATANTGKIIAYSDDNVCGAFVTTGTLTIDPSLRMTGSTTYAAAEAEITGETGFDEEKHYVTTGDVVALSVLILKTAPAHNYDANHRCTDCHDMDPQYQLEKDAALALVKGVYELDTGTFDFVSADELVRMNGEPLYGVNELKFYRVDNTVYAIHGGASHAKKVTFVLDGNGKVISVTTHDPMTEAITGTYTAPVNGDPDIGGSGNVEGGVSAGAVIGITLGSVLLLLLIAYVVFFFIWKKKEAFPTALAFLGFLEPSYKAINNALFKKKAEEKPEETENKDNR